MEMNRLTYQKRDGNYSIRFDLGNLQQVDIKANNKLGHLEDLEQELGCTLDVIFKAKKQKHIFVDKAYCCAAGEVYKLEDKKLCYVNIDLSIQFTAVEEIDDYFKEFANRWCWQFQYNIDHDDYSWDWYLVKLTDYKKTWWLKEDRSE